MVVGGRFAPPSGSRAEPDESSLPAFMTLRWLLASAHLLALVVGSAGIGIRAFALRRVHADPGGLRTVFAADSLWGIAAILWIATGLWRAFSGLEKGGAYYLGSTAFWLKMALLLVVLILEGRPMLTLIRWRVASSRGDTIDLSPARALARVSTVQLVLIALMVLLATAMARGLLR
jgi:putative membrane protein